MTFFLPPCLKILAMLSKLHTHCDISIKRVIFHGVTVFDSEVAWSVSTTQAHIHDVSDIAGNCNRERGCGRYDKFRFLTSDKFNMGHGEMSETSTKKFHNPGWQQHPETKTCCESIQYVCHCNWYIVTVSCYNITKLIRKLSLYQDHNLMGIC